MITANDIIAGEYTLDIVPQASKGKYLDTDFDICIVAEDYITGVFCVYPRHTLSN